MSNPEQVNILLVDDQPDKLLSYEVILGSLGENLVKANSAKEALEILLKTDVAVVLVDVCMPEIDGFELATIIREHPRHQKTAIILVSAVLMTDIDRLKGYDRGAMDYVPVPVVPEILRAKVTVFVDLYRKTRQLERLNRELEHRVMARTAELQHSTERMRESEQRLSLALESADAISWDWDLPANRLTWTDRHRRNPAPAESRELTLEEWLTRVHPEDRTRLSLRIQQMRETPGDDDWNEEFRLLDSSKNARWFSGLGRAVRDEQAKIIRMTGIDLDVTDRKRVEEERSRLLESERAARAEAESADRAKDEFLAVLSHELRTPLHSILGWSQILRRKAGDKTTVSKALDTIESSARAQTKLIGDLIDMSRITAGKIRLELQPLNLISIVQTTIDGFTPSAEAAGLKIVQDLAPLGGSVLGDSARFQQIVTNLLSNAIKFTPSGGKIRVALKQEKAYVELSVSDTGEGIAAELLPHVFERFRQADSSSIRKHGGLGLGLTLVKHFTELHGGMVAASSRGEGKGATFTVRLPVAFQKSMDFPELSDPKIKDINLTRVRALVVDDDPGAAEIVQRLLCEQGARVQTAHSAIAALASFDTFAPNLLVSDIGMPDMNGYEMMQKIRARQKFHIPALALTAYARSEDGMRAMQAGYDAHLSKPADPGALLSTVAALLRAEGQKNGECSATS